MAAFTEPLGLREVLAMALTFGGVGRADDEGRLIGARIRRAIELIAR